MNNKWKKKVFRPKKKTGKPAKTAKGRMPKSMSPKNDMASIIEGKNDFDIEPNVVYTQQLDIRSFPRALILASQFKFMRAVKVEYRILPRYNTYQEGTGITKPYLYYAFNRNGAQLPGLIGTGSTLFQLERMGAKPISLTKLVDLKYVPNTLVGEASSHYMNPQTTNPPNVPGGNINWSFVPKYKEWISTEFLRSTPYGLSSLGGPPLNPAGFGPPTYYGMWFTVAQDGVPEEATIADAQVRVHWEFKEPASLTDVSEQNMANIAQTVPTEQL